MEPNKSPIDITTYNISWANAAGAVVSNAHDNALWLKALLINQTLLPQKQQNELMSRVDFDKGQPISPESKEAGAGLEVWYANDEKLGDIWFRGGASLGYLAQMAWLKTYNIGITVSTDTDGDADNATDGFQAIFNDVATYVVNQTHTEDSQ